MFITRPKTIIILAAAFVACFSIYYATAGIFKTNTPIIDRWADGLVGYWTFNGQDTDWSANTATDSSINSNTGTMTNMSITTSPAPGIIGQALDFDGADDYVDVSTPTGWSNSQGTFSAWLKPNFAYDVGSHQGVWVMYTNNDDRAVFYYDSALDSWLFVIDMGAVNYAYSLTQSFSAGNWIHVTSVWDSGGKYVYINGVKGTDEATILSQTITDLLIGTNWYNNVTDSPFNGLIDEARIYNRALSATEIAEHYRTGAERLVKTNMPTTDRWANGLVGYWTFNGQDTDWSANTAADSSTNSNTGTMTNMSTTTSPTPGIIGQALEFDGVDDYIDMVDANGVINVNAGTITAWIKMNSMSSNGVIYSSRVDANNNLEIFWNEDNGTLDIKYKAGGIVNQIQSTTIADSNNNWNQVVLTWDTSVDQVKAYINGNQNGSTQTSLGTWSGSISASKIGANPTNFFNGLIDEFRIYNRALSAAEIAEHYRAGAERLIKTNMPTTDRWTNGLVGYWTFNGQDTDWSANTATDSSTNSNTGTMTNMSTSTSPAPGIIGQALDFDGVDDYVEVGDIGDLGAQYTAMAWVKFDDVISNNIIISYRTNDQVDAANVAIQIDHNGDDARFLVRDDASVLALASKADVLNTTDWFFVAGVKDGNNLSLYVNNLSVATDSDTFGTLYMNKLILGNYWADNTDAIGSSWFDGLIDEVRIYDRALSATEIAEHYQAGAGR